MKQINTRTESILFDDAGIIICKVFKGAHLDGDDARENIEAVKKLANGKRVPVLVDISESGGATREAREYFTKPEVAEVQSACALIVGSQLSYIIGSFFMGLNKPKFPTRLFHNREKAIKWLKNYI